MGDASSTGHLLYLATDDYGTPVWRYFASTTGGNAGLREALEWMDWTLRVRIPGDGWGLIKVVSVPDNGDPGTYLFRKRGARMRSHYFFSRQQPSWDFLATDDDASGPLDAVGAVGRGISEGATIGGAVGTGLGLAGAVATSGVVATVGSALTAGVAATAASGATAAASAIGIGAAAGNAIPIPGVGAAIGAAIGALVAAGTWIANSLKDTFHPTQEQAEDWLWMFRIDPVLCFLNVDKATDPQSAARLVRYFRVIAEVPVGVKGNNGVLYNPVSNDSCDNPYLCRVDPDEPLTDPAFLDRYFRGLQAVATRTGKQIWQLPPGVYHAFAPSTIRTPVEARAALRFLAKHAEAIWAWSEIQGNLGQVQDELRAMKLLADGKDPSDPWHRRHSAAARARFLSHPAELRARLARAAAARAA